MPEPVAAEPPEEITDSGVRSIESLTGYKIQASDGGIGHLHDLILDDESWALRYLIVETGHWLPGRQLLIAPDWVEQISWHDEQLILTVTREQVEASLAFDPSAPVNRQSEEHLYDYYGRERYSQ